MGMDESIDSQYTDVCATINASLEAVKALHLNFSQKVDSLDDENQQLRSSLKAANSEVCDLRKRIESAEAAAAAAKNEHAAYKVEMLAAEKESAALVSSLRQELAVSHATHEETRAALVEERKKAKEAAKTSSATVKELNGTLDTVRDALEKQKETCANLQMDLSSSKSKLVQTTGEVSVARAELSAVNAQFVDLQREISVAKMEVSAAEKDGKAKMEALLVSKEEAAELKALLNDKVAEEAAAHQVTRTQLERLKQESFNLYTAYTKSMQQLQEFREALERETQESARLHQAMAQAKQEAARDAMRLRSSNTMLPPSSIATMGNMGLSTPSISENIDVDSTTPKPTLRPLGTGKENDFSLDTIERRFAVVD